MHAILALRMKSDREAIGLNSLIQNAYETIGLFNKGRSDREAIAIFNN